MENVALVDTKDNGQSVGRVGLLLLLPKGRWAGEGDGDGEGEGGYCVGQPMKI